MAAEEKYYKGKYDNEYKMLHIETEQICDDIASNSAKTFYTNVSEIQNQVKGLQMESSWEDGVETMFESNKTAVVTSLGDLLGYINTFESFQGVYNDLNQQLNNLKKADSKYTELYNNEPRKEDYSTKDEEGKWVVSDDYYDVHSTWEGDVDTLGGRCQELCNQVELYKQTLEDIDAIASLEDGKDFKIPDGLEVIPFNSDEFKFEYSEPPQGEVAFTLADYNFYEVPYPEDRDVGDYDEGDPLYKTTINIGGIEKDIYISGDLASNMKENSGRYYDQDCYFIETYMNGLKGIAEGDCSKLVTDNVDYMFFGTAYGGKAFGYQYNNGSDIYGGTHRYFPAGDDLASKKEYMSLTDIITADMITGIIKQKEDLWSKDPVTGQELDNDTLWSLVYQFRESINAPQITPGIGLSEMMAVCDANPDKYKGTPIYDYYEKWWPAVTGLDPK